MVDLAKEAFATNNFDLAADIYERTIRETGPKPELFLGLADSFARGGQFSKAFDAYTNAYRYGKVSHEKLKHLVTGLILTVKQENSSGGQQIKKGCMFSCGMCRGLLDDPVTIPCGHSFCRKCLHKDATKKCDTCGIVHFTLKVKNIRSNVVLCNLIDKWFPCECKANRLKQEGNNYFEKGDLHKAAEAYSQAIVFAPTDHLLLSNRCHVYVSLELFSEALVDAESVVKLRPDWPKGYFRKGCALYGLAKYDDAVVAFLQCLALDPRVGSAKDYLSKSLDKILSAQPPDDPKSFTIQQQTNPSFLHQLIERNFRRSLLLPDMDISGTLSNLAQIVKDTVNVASNFNKEPTPQVFTRLQQEEDGASASEMEIQHIMDNFSLHKMRCNSLPDCSDVDHEELKRVTMPRSYSPRTVSSRKRLRNVGSSQCPLSPTHSSPEKAAKPTFSGFDGGNAIPSVPPSTLPMSSTDSSHPSSPMHHVIQYQKSAEDVECGLCYRLFYEPVTTPCGHTFCRQCLDRSLDHTVSCPMCKGDVAECLAERHAVTEAIKSIMETYFKEEYQERCKIHDEEMIELTRMGGEQQSEIPIFVCTLTFPSMPCPLHIFEPRYRLMVRQCMESGTRQFGMCLHTNGSDSDFSDYGCMLEIRDVQYFPDGRSVLDTIGGKRFRVVSRGQREGYNTAKVEFIKDTPIDEEDIPVVNKMQEEVHAMVKKWLHRLPSYSQMKITQHFGEMPGYETSPAFQDNGPRWAWWSLAVLPLDERVKLALIAMCSFKERLKALKKVMEHIERQRSQ